MRSAAPRSLAESSPLRSNIFYPLCESLCSLLQFCKCSTLSKFFFFFLLTKLHPCLRDVFWSFTHAGRKWHPITWDRRRDGSCLTCWWNVLRRNQLQRRVARCPCARDRSAVCEHTVRLCIFICACTLEQKGKWKQITVMGVDAARWTHGELFCGETRNRPGPDCQLPVIIVMLQKSTKKANHLYEWHIHTHTHTNGKGQEVYWTQVYSLTWNCFGLSRIEEGVPRLLHIIITH